MTVAAIITSLPEKTAEQRARMRRNAEARLETGPAQLRQDARDLLDALDALEHSEHVARTDWVANATVKERVRKAFETLPPTETEIRLLRVLLDNPGTSSAGLSEKLGWGGQTWHMHFGEMCKAREAWLWPAEKAEKRDGHFYSGILAVFDPEGSRFTMKPEVAAALHEMGLGGPVRPVAG